MKAQAGDIQTEAIALPVTPRPYPVYKSSGLDWLGEVPEHWELRRTKTVLRQRVEKGHPNEPLLAATQTKGVVRKELYENRTVLAMKDLHLLKLVHVKDFVISLRSFQGGIEYARERGIISPAYTVLYPSNRSHHGYLAKLFKSEPYVQNLTLFVTGIRQGQNIDYDRLSRSSLPLPPLPEQRAIVRFLDHADHRIRRYLRAKERLIELLEEQKQAIIHQAVTGQIDVRTGQPYPAYKNSGVEWLGKVPEHWEVRRLKQVSSIQGGFAFSTDSFGNEGIPVVRMNNIRRGTLDLENVVRIPEDKSKDAFALKEGDIIYGLSGSIGATGSLGNYAVIKSRDIPAQLNQRIARFRPVIDRITEEFLVWSLQTSILYRQVLSHTTGTAQFNVSTNDLGNVAMALPPVEEQWKVTKHLSTIITDIGIAVSRARRQIELLQEYRTRLIADVVTGKFDVGEVAARLTSPTKFHLDRNGEIPHDNLDTKHTAILKGESDNSDKK